MVPGRAPGRAKHTAEDPEQKVVSGFFFPLRSFAVRFVPRRASRRDRLPLGPRGPP